MKPPPAPKPVRSTLVVWVGFVLLFLAIWQFQQGGSGSSSGPFSNTAMFAPLLVVPLFLVVFVVALLRGRAATKSQFEALALLARGNLAEAEASFERLSRSQLVLVRASAFSWLATLAEQRADFSRALELCDAGIASLPTRYRPQAADVLFPGLLAQRASVLAALDRAAEAESELLAMRQHYPWFPSTTKAVFVTRLRALARKGDIAGAAHLAASRSPLLPLTAEEELLADVAMCAAGAPGAVKAGEIRDRLEAWNEGATWIVRVAPKVWEAYLRASP
jgi:tetratricopeptide (TPR) repeat protein